MKQHLFSSLVRSIVLLSLAAFVALAGEGKAKAPDSLKAEYMDDQIIQLGWIATGGAKQFAIYRAEVHKLSENLDYAKLRFTNVSVVEEPKFSDGFLTEGKTGGNKPVLLVYYVTSVDESGTESAGSNYAEVILSPE